MGDRGYLFFAFLFLAMLSWGQLIRDMNNGRAHLDPWRAEPVWRHEEAGNLQALESVKGGEDGTSVVVAQWERARRVLDHEGNVLAHAPAPLGDPAAPGTSGGCVSPVASPKLLWSQCFPNQAGESHQDRFLGALRYVQLYHLVVAQRTGSVQVPLGHGEVRWSYNAQGGINDMVVEDLNGTGTGEVILATPAGQVIALDAEGGEQWRADLGEPIRILEVIEWDGTPQSLEVAAGSDQGKVVVLDAQGQKLEEWDDWGNPVVDLVQVDLDHDGRGDLAAALNGPFFQVFRHGVPSLTVRLPEAPQKLAAVDDLLVVGSGSRVQAYRLVASSWLGQYRPMLGSVIFTLVIFVVGLQVILLHPRLEIGSYRRKA
jgi:hypothetical protein